MKTNTASQMQGSAQRWCPPEPRGGAAPAAAARERACEQKCLEKVPVRGERAARRPHRGCRENSCPRGFPVARAGATHCPVFREPSRHGTSEDRPGKASSGPSPVLPLPLRVSRPRAAVRLGKAGARVCQIPHPSLRGKKARQCKSCFVSATN